jgi:hypothetical protein
MAKAKTIPFGELRAKLLENPVVAAEYERLGPGFELAEKLIRARKSAGVRRPMRQGCLLVCAKNPCHRSVRFSLSVMTQATLCRSETDAHPIHT